MSDSDTDEEFSNTYVPYSQRPDWADVTPLPQDDGPNPVVAINYSPHFQEVYDYVRAVIARQEKSRRVLELTKDALRLNPANYTVWLYRREVLQELGCDLREELDYLDDVVRQNTKNYQVWHHRQVICELLNDGSRELELTASALYVDAKNYHAWQHRQWAIRRFELYDNELEYIDRQLANDQRNNSAWNQRFFVIKHYGFTPEIVERELAYAMDRLRLITKNESVWNYLIGIMRHSADRQLSSHPKVTEFVEGLYNHGNRSPFLLAYLVDLYQELALRDSNENGEYADKAYDLCETLAEQYDVVRRKYWQYIAESLRTKLAEAKNSHF